MAIWNDDANSGKFVLGGGSGRDISIGLFGLLDLEGNEGQRSVISDRLTIWKYQDIGD